MDVPPDVPSVDPDAVVRGAGSIDHLPEIVAGSGARTALLICGRTSFEASGGARILPQLRRDVDVRIWDGHRANPTVDDVYAGLEAAHDHAPDVIIGVGGGSTLDVTKVVAALHEAGNRPDRDDITRQVVAHQIAAERTVGLILAPTTSGSGAQATHFATIYLDATKHSVAGAGLVPDTVILDPQLAMSASAYQRACSGIDALAQAIESMWAVGADDLSREMAASAIDALLPNLAAFVESPDAANGDAMASGSHLAGRAINRSRTTIPHALSYAITQTTGLPHGHAVAHTLPAVFERHLRSSPPLAPGMSAQQHARTMQQLVQTIGESDAGAAVDRIDGLIRRIGLREPESSARSMIVRLSEQIAGSVDPMRSGNNPVQFSARDLREILVEASA